MTTFILVIIVISILILAHELGHFYSARFLKIRVEEFGFGFPPKIWSKVKNGIRYSVNLLPFGGFVKIYGEHGEGEGSRDSFISRPVWQRFIVLAAGVCMNIALAWVLFSMGTLGGTPEINDSAPRGTPVSIVGVMPNSPAEKADIKLGDQIIEMRGANSSLHIETEKDVRTFIDRYRGEEITLVVRRDNHLLEISAIPRSNVPDGEGPLGIALGRITLTHTPWYKAPLEGATATMRATALTVSGLFSLIKEIAVEKKVAVAVSGPIGIFFLIGDSTGLGIPYFMNFVALLSINLAVLNFLPIPALDGGRVLFLIIEKIKGRRVNEKWENFAHTLGFAFLILIMILVTYRDIARVF